MSNFGQMMRNHRKLRGRSAKEVAREIGVSKQYLADIELGRRAAPNDIALLIFWAVAVDLPACNVFQCALIDREPKLCAQLGIDDPLPETVVATREGRRG